MDMELVHFSFIRRGTKLCTYVNKGLKRPSIPVATITTGLDKVVKDYFNLFRTKDKLPDMIAAKVPEN
jgi:hypothetical protein